MTNHKRGHLTIVASRNTKYERVIFCEKIAKIDHSFRVGPKGNTNYPLKPIDSSTFTAAWVSGFSGHELAQVLFALGNKNALKLIDVMINESMSTDKVIALQEFKKLFESKI